MAGSESRAVWRVSSFGPRRNGGFLKISLPNADNQELCMSEQKGLLDKHRKAELCGEKHISHVW